MRLKNRHFVLTGHAKYWWQNVRYQIGDEVTAWQPGDIEVLLRTGWTEVEEVKTAKAPAAPEPEPAPEAPATKRKLRRFVN